ERVRLLPAAGPPGAPNIAAGTLRDLAYRGEASVALVATTGGQVLRVVVPGGAKPPAPGGEVALAWDDGANIVLSG
ncbi:MAG: hypothetical protein AVDCRST_MAG08-3722, partial [uncultured Acetobacteraceae bacterium]